MLPPSGRSGSAEPQSGVRWALERFVRFCSTTFCKPCKRFAFAYSGLQNVIYLFALGDICFLLVVY
jgi:hypothetical protein